MRHQHDAALAGLSRDLGQRQRDDANCRRGGGEDPRRSHLAQLHFTPARSVRPITVGGFLIPATETESQFQLERNSGL